MDEFVKFLEKEIHDYYVVNYGHHTLSINDSIACLIFHAVDNNRITEEQGDMLYKKYKVG